MDQRRDIYLRAHTSQHTDKPRAKRGGGEVSIPKWREHALIPTPWPRTDVHQDLMVGTYRVCKLVSDRFLCESEGSSTLRRLRRRS